MHSKSLYYIVFGLCLLSSVAIGIFGAPASNQCHRSAAPHVKPKDYKLIKPYPHDLDLTNEGTCDYPISIWDHAGNLVGSGFLGTSTPTTKGMSYVVNKWSPHTNKPILAKVFYDVEQADIESLKTQTITKGVNADRYYFVITGSTN